MRCVGLTGPVTVMGSQGGIRLQQGWEGDVDQVIGRTEQGKPVTVADSLGPELLKHFEKVETPKADERPRVSRRGSALPAVSESPAGPVTRPTEE